MASPALRDKFVRVVPARFCVRSDRHSATGFVLIARAATAIAAHVGAFVQAERLVFGAFAPAEPVRWCAEPTAQTRRQATRTAGLVAVCAVRVQTALQVPVCVWLVLIRARVAV